MCLYRAAKLWRSASLPCTTIVSLGIFWITRGLAHSALARYWDDPHAFKPERFHGDWPRDAFLPFSGGARACLGRRYVAPHELGSYLANSKMLWRSFFETEGIAILTMLVSRYKIELKDEPQFANETYEERWERLFHVSRAITIA